MFDPLNRRHLLQALAGSFTCAVAPKLLSATPALAKTGGRHPRQVLIIYCAGGLDAIWTSDPKTRKQVEADIDVPYNSSSIIHSNGGLLGPHLKPLVGNLSRGVIINGVHVGTANHETGSLQSSRLRQRPDVRMPTILELVASTGASNAPLSVMSMGRGDFTYSPSFAHDLNRTATTDLPSLFSALEELPRNQLITLAEQLRTQARQFNSFGSFEARVSAKNCIEAAGYCERLPNVPRFSVQPWTENPWQGPNSAFLQRALWALENQMARTTLVAAYGSWDSHADNTVLQSAANAPFFSLVSRLLTELAVRRNEHGPLLEQTLVVMSSELGRFPKLNSYGGKDHLPEVPYMFFGAGLNPMSMGQVLGSTDRQMLARTIDPKTGRFLANGHRLTLNDIGSSVLRMFGLDAPTYGYRGEQLPFLFQS